MGKALSALGGRVAVSNDGAHCYSMTPANPSSLITLEAFDAERADFERVLGAIRRFQGASETELHDLEWVCEVVGSVGLSPLFPAEEIYGDVAGLMNSSHQGITQYPREFARWLLLLGASRVSTYLEIGCYNGGTACLATAYLHRLNPDLRAITVDITPWFFFHPLVQDLIPLQYHSGRTSLDYRGQTFDAVFIDGDHSFPWALADFRNVGEAARFCGIHDVKSRHFLESEPLGGVNGVWELIKRDTGGPGVEFMEYFDHPLEHFGIGVRARRQAEVS
jgi:hypothetical protein